MSGLEGFVLSAGGRLLGSLAAPAARALAHRLTFRWSVSRKVRKGVDFPCKWRAYRTWLKSITAEELGAPVEEIQGALAMRLDDALSAQTKAWSSADDHLSRALRLVELTYPAIAAALHDEKRAQLSESWAQQRSVNTRDHLLQLLGPSASLSPADLAKVLQKRSEARRAVRLRPFDIEESTLAPHFERIEVVNVPAGGVLVLQGGFGSGKSETAETWHRACIERFANRDRAPFPVWFSARDLDGQVLEGAIDRQLRPAWRSGRGASITIDGMDEVDPAAAQTMLEAARVLTMTYSNVQVLLTARPGALTPVENEAITAELLSEDDALQLVELAGDKSRSRWHWTANMRATVRTPFFALAAGAMLGSDSAPRGEADLIRNLVESALKKGTERSAVTTGETRSVLERLAVALTRTGHDRLSFADRQIARSSRLVADGPQDLVLFSLPIFQHWFAAQAILSGDVPAEEVVADAQNFNRWRWAAAVAALSEPGVNEVDSLLSTWVSGNPGAAAWIIKEAFAGYRDWRTAEDNELDAKTSGTRLLRAMRTWTDALGPLAVGVVPRPLVQGPVMLGVTASGHRINVAFSTSQPSADCVTDVPPEVHPLARDASSEWRSWLSGGVPQGHAWPWTMMRKRIAGETLKKLTNDPFMGSPDGVWVQERRFDLARRLLRRGSLFNGSMPADEVRRRALELFEHLGSERLSQVSFSGSAHYTGAEVEDLISWIEATGANQVRSYLPAPDVQNPPSTWVWDFYSPERLMEFEAGLYGRACEAYDEALAHTFAQIGWSMPSSALAPFGVILHLRTEDSARTEWGSVGVSHIRVPMALLPNLAPKSRNAVWSANGRAVIVPEERDRSSEREYFLAALEHVRSWLATQGREPTGGLSWTSAVANQMADVRPASSVAAAWLWDDLKSIGLGDGTFPQLR